MCRAVRILIVDSSRRLRRWMRELLEAAGFIVTGEASDGHSASVQNQRLAPDLILLDLDLGLETIDQLTAHRPVPILGLAGGPPPFEALGRGAVELLPKPKTFDALTEGKRLIEVARRAARMPLARTRSTTARSWAPASLVCVGGSTGAPSVLRSLLTDLGRVPVPVVVVQHVAEPFAAGFVDWLDALSRMWVIEARPGLPLRPGCLHVIVRGPHLRIGADGQFHAWECATPSLEPSIDVLFESAAEHGRDRTLGILLTRTSPDGARGLAAISDAGGQILAEDESDSGSDVARAIRAAVGAGG